MGERNSRCPQKIVGHPSRTSQSVHYPWECETPASSASASQCLGRRISDRGVIHFERGVVGIARRDEIEIRRQQRRVLEIDGFRRAQIRREFASVQTVWRRGRDSNRRYSYAPPSVSCGGGVWGTFCTLSSCVNTCVTPGAQGDQVVLCVFSGVAAEFSVVNFQIRHCATRLTPPAIPTQDLLA